MPIDLPTAEPAPAALPGARELVARNGRFYDAFWARTYLTRPESFNTWPLVSGLLAGAPRRLEIGPGLRPRLPIAGTHFLDLSPPAVARLQARGGLAQTGEITALPYAAGRFDLVAAFDVVEHVEDDNRVFAELTRVLAAGGRLVFSVPLHPARWTVFDDCVGHARRYEPAALSALLGRHGLVVEQSAVFGMQSNNPRLLRRAVDGLTKHPAIAVRCYNWLFFPLGLLFQSRLKLMAGLMDLAAVDEVLLVCRRTDQGNQAAPRPDIRCPEPG
ncbi:MAG: class I SAM-dependent methyltransferase [Lacunisphaera sp.]|nr:class I SAM-dependent methyltransferase [Lacunisphaera sp.]